jgi:hypothetical protein
MYRLIMLFIIMLRCCVNNSWWSCRRQCDEFRTGGHQVGIDSSSSSAIGVRGTSVQGIGRRGYIIFMIILLLFFYLKVTNMM